MKQHKKTGSGVWNSWVCMMARCYYSTDICYARYGGRGITVCERWKDFRNFFSDMGDRPENMRLERINNDGNYEPSNCKWATHKEQARNKSNNTVFTINGITGCMTELAEKFGISPYTVASRINMLGMTPEDAMLKPVRKKRKGRRLSGKEVSEIRSLYFQKVKTTTEIAIQFGVTYMAISKIVKFENHKVR